MASKPLSKLSRRKRYLQVAFNSTLEEARQIIAQLPRSDRILIEAGTPLIKRYGADGIRKLRDWYATHLAGMPVLPLVTPAARGGLLSLFFSQQALAQLAAFRKSLRQPSSVDGGENAASVPANDGPLSPYVIADLKTMDRGATEAQLAAESGASAAVALGTAPIETLNAFLDACAAYGLDAMIDMMHVDFPLGVLRKLRRPPAVVILHRGVDEEHYNREKMLPLHEIRRIKGQFDSLIAIAGGDTAREVQSAVFNDADIVVIWKSVYRPTQDTIAVIDGFLKQVK